MIEPDDDETQTHRVLTKGTTIDRYRIIEKIGAGGMGEVYLAEDTELDRKVALKFLSPHLCQDEDCRKRFKREARAAAGLNHPNIVTIYEVGDYQGRPYFAMELVNGPSLAQYINEKKRIEEHEALTITGKVARALAFSHTKNIVHRDIKPENILLDEYLTPKVTDFGVVMHQDDDHMTLTQEGFMVGSVHFSSPEQVEGARDIDGRSDIYSLGATLSTSC